RARPARRDRRRSPRVRLPRRRGAVQAPARARQAPAGHAHRRRAVAPRAHRDRHRRRARPRRGPRAPGARHSPRAARRRAAVARPQARARRPRSSPGPAGRAVTSDLVSVIIPSYNRAYCIAATVDSALAQSHQNLEILVVDDGSKDATRDLIAERYGREPRVRYLHQANSGVSAARNHGLRVATGDYLALLDSDDLWLPWKVEAQLRCLAALPSAGMIWTDMDAIGPGGELLQRRYLTTMYSSYQRFSREQLFRDARPLSAIDARLAAQLDDPRVFLGDIFSPMITGNLVHTSTVLLRRARFELVREFDVELRYSGEDYDFHLRTCRDGDVAYLDAPSILYQRGREDQLTNRKYSVHMAEN